MKKAGDGDREVNLKIGLGQDWEIEVLRDQKIRVCHHLEVSECCFGG